MKPSIATRLPTLLPISESESSMTPVREAYKKANAEDKFTLIIKTK